jgi:DNA-directed RNA polymerase subunit RPC12/RpoP
MTKEEAKKRADIVKLWDEVRDSHYNDGLSWYQACREWDCLLDEDSESQDEVEQYTPCRYCGTQPEITLHKKYSEMKCPNCEHRVQSKPFLDHGALRDALIKRWDEYNEGQKEGNQSAFPIIFDNGGVLDYGLSKREFVAATIVSGMIANSQNPTTNNEQIARRAIRLTDALLFELNKSE